MRIIGLASLLFLSSLAIGQTINPDQIRPATSDNQVLTTVTANTPPVWAAGGGSGSVGPGIPPSFPIYTGGSTGPGPVTSVIIQQGGNYNECPSGFNFEGSGTGASATPVCSNLGGTFQITGYTSLVGGSGYSNLSNVAAVCTGGCTGYGFAGIYTAQSVTTSIEGDTNLYDDPDIGLQYNGPGIALTDTLGANGIVISSFNNPDIHGSDDILIENNSDAIEMIDPNTTDNPGIGPDGVLTIEGGAIYIAAGAFSKTPDPLVINSEAFFTRELVPSSGNHNWCGSSFTSSQSILNGCQAWMIQGGSSGTTYTVEPAANNGFTIAGNTGLKLSWVTFCKSDSAAGSVTLIPTSGDTIDGTTSLVLTTQYQCAQLMSDGDNNWYQVNNGGSGSGGSVGTAGQLQMVGSTAGSFAASAATDNGSVFTITEPASIASAGASQWGFTYNATPIVPGSSTTAVVGADSSGRFVRSNAGNSAVILSGIASPGTAGDCAEYAANGYDLADTGSACGSGGGSTAWSSLTNPTTNLALNLSTNTTTFTGGLAMLTGAYEQQNTWTVGSVNVPAIYQGFRTVYGFGTLQNSIADEFSLAVPSSSTQYEVNDIGAYETCDSAATICIPLSTTVVREVANTNVEAANFNSWDNNLGGSDFFGIEVDTVAQNAGTSGEMIRLLPWIDSLSNPFYGIHLLADPHNGGQPITSFLQTDNESAVNFADIGESSTGSGSQKINWGNGSTSYAMFLTSGGVLDFVNAVAFGTSGQFNVSSTGATVVPSLTIGSLSGCLLGTSGAVSAGCTLSSIAAGTAGTGTYDFSGATQLKLPVAAGYTSAANGEVGYDSTNKNFHAWVNGADTLLVPLPTTFTSGDCPEPTNTAGTWAFADSGGPCGTSGGGAAWSAVTAGTNAATLVEGSGGSLTPSGTGLIDANELGPAGAAVPFCTGFTPTNGQNLQYTTGGSPNPCYTASTGSGTTVTPAPPYLEIGSTFYIPADHMSTATKPATFSSGCTFSATFSWLNSVTPSNCTNGTNGNQLLQNTSSITAWASATATTSVEGVLNLASNAITNTSSDFPESGVWIYDSTNGKIYVLNVDVSSASITVASQIVTQVQIYTCTSPCSATNPVFSSTVAGYVLGTYGPGSPAHYKLSVSGSTLSFSYSLDGGADFIALPTTESVGTITKGGYMISNTLANANIMSIKVQ